MRLGMYLGAGGVAAMGLMGAASVEAAPVAFELVTASVGFNITEPGLVVDVEVLGGGFPPVFYLDEGDSYTFDLFTISGNEWFVDDEDFAPMPITATLFFAGMDSVSVEGTTAATDHFTGVADFPGPIAFIRNGIEFTVTLSDATFWLPGQTSRVLPEPGTVTATIARPGGTVVPTPAAATAGLALLGGAIARRRRA